LVRTPQLFVPRFAPSPIFLFLMPALPPFNQHAEMGRLALFTDGAWEPIFPSFLFLSILRLPDFDSGKQPGSSPSVSSPAPRLCHFSAAPRARRETWDFVLISFFGFLLSVTSFHHHRQFFPFGRPLFFFFPESPQLAPILENKIKFYSLPFFLCLKSFSLLLSPLSSFFSLP